MATTLNQPPQTTPSASRQVSREDYKFLQDYVYRESGIVLDSDKQYLLDARLLPVARKNGLGAVEDLCALLRGVCPGAVRQQVIEAMTTNETLFFRELPQYEALRKVILPELTGGRAGARPLSFWSAAASSGQEAYSLAMMLREMGLPGGPPRIYATDLNTSVLDRARQGRYLQIEVNRGLPVSYLLKYFNRAGLEWELKEEVRRMVAFEQFDLRQSARSKGPFDVVFCRNVLIYFDLSTKRHIVRQIRSAMHKGGYLFLGGAETLLNIEEGLKRVEVGSSVAYRAD